MYKNCIKKNEDMSIADFWQKQFQYFHKMTPKRMSSPRDTYFLIRMPPHQESSWGSQCSLLTATILENIQCLISSLASTNPRQYHHTNSSADSLSLPTDTSVHTATCSARAGCKLFGTNSCCTLNSLNLLSLHQGGKKRGCMLTVWGAWRTPF